MLKHRPTDHSHTYIPPDAFSNWTHQTAQQGAERDPAERDRSHFQSLPPGATARATESNRIICIDHDLPHDHGVWYDRGNHPTVQTTRPMSPPQPQPPHPLTQTPRDQSRPAHAPGNPFRCDHISQSVLTTTSHTTTGCGTTGGNHPTVQTTRPMSPPQPQPPHPLTQTPRDQSRPAHAPGNPSRCDHISQSLWTTTSHTTTGCGTTRRNHPTVQNVPV